MSASTLFLGDAAARLRASVVAIVDESRGGRRAGRALHGGHGAGFACGRDLFVTSAHVLSANTGLVVTADGRAVEGAVVGRDVDRDIAVVRAPKARVPAATIGDPYALRPGSLVFAVGHPLGVRDAGSRPTCNWPPGTPADRSPM